MTTTPIIALLTDFGVDDAYVGVMKGVMLGICPNAQLVDLTHAIAPQNLRQAAYMLLTAHRHFPPHTVFLVVVDPGVGTARQPVAVATDHGRYVAPDNGVLSYALAQVGVLGSVAIANPAYRLAEVSKTFHGRDVFSPAAAHLARGVDVSELGPAQRDLVRLPPPTLDLIPGGICGEVLHVDHFGNLVTSIGHLAWLDADTLHLTPRFGSARLNPVTLDARRCRMVVGARQLEGIQMTYAAVERGAAALLVGSSGQLEVGINQGSAAQAFGIVPGDSVTLTVTS